MSGKWTVRLEWQPSWNAGKGRLWCIRDPRGELRYPPSVGTCAGHTDAVRMAVELAEIEAGLRHPNGCRRPW